MLRDAFAEMWRRQQSINESLVGVGSIVGQKRRHFVRRRRQAREIQCHSTNQRAAIRFGRMSKAFLLQAIQYKGIDGVGTPIWLAHSRRNWTTGRQEGPVSRPVC